MKDRGEIIPLLHSLRRPTFFTRDRDFYKSDLCHRRYCLVFLDVAFDEAAEFIRRFLRHSAFRTQIQRIGRVIRVHHTGVSYRQAHDKKAHALKW